MSGGSDRTAAPVEPLAALTAALSAAGSSGWLVGGAVRDQLLGRPTLDYDVAVDGDVAALAKAVGRAAGGHAFLLSDDFGGWRVKGRSADWQLDLTPLTGPTIEADLRGRDLTINAIARELVSGRGPDGGELVDVTGGVADLEARRLRATGPDAFDSDPLRTVRLARFAAQFARGGFTVDPRTASLAQIAAPKLQDTPGERVFQELRQLISAPEPVLGLELLRTSGVMRVVLPEVQALRGIEQSEYHHLDVYGHTMLTLQLATELETDPARFFPDHSQIVADYLAQPFANEMNRAQTLRFGALLHDIAKPQTRAVTPEGRITFFSHDEQGAELSARILRRLRASDKLATHVATLTRHHLRLGFLVHRQPLDRRTIYDYLHTCSPAAVDVTLLSLADRFATLGKNHEQAGASHLDLAREMFSHAIGWEQDPPKPPLRGDELAQALGIEPGPRLGLLIAELTAATYTGEVTSPESAVVYARGRLAATPPDTAG